MKRIDLIIWERGDRVITRMGPASVVREAANPWAARAMVNVLLDEPYAGFREYAFDGADLQPEGSVSAGR